MLTGLCSVDENNVVGISSTQRKETLSKFVGKGIYINHKKNYVNLICDEASFNFCQPNC